MPNVTNIVIGCPGSAVEVAFSKQGRLGETEYALGA